jgi:hypothetical protein
MSSIAGRKWPDNSIINQRRDLPVDLGHLLFYKFRGKNTPMKGIVNTYS